MKINGEFYLQGRASSSLDIDKNLLRVMNWELSRYVVADDFSKTPKIKSIAELENMARAYVFGELDDFYNFGIVPRYCVDEGNDSRNLDDISVPIKWFSEEISFLFDYYLYQKHFDYIEYITDDWSCEIEE